MPRQDEIAPSGDMPIAEPLRPATDQTRPTSPDATDPGAGRERVAGHGRGGQRRQAVCRDRPEAALEGQGRGRLKAGVLEERVQVPVPVAPIATVEDADAREATLIGPGTDGVGMDAEQACRATHRQRRPFRPRVDDGDLQRKR